MTRYSPRTALLAAALCLALVAPPAAFAAGAGTAAPADTAMMAHAMPNAVFTLRTGIAQGKMVYIGKGGDIDGKANPTLTVHEGDVVQITLVNGEGAEHDIVLPDLHAASQRVSSPGASSTLTFRAGDIGTFVYFCSIGGHREAGMQGTIKVEATAPKVADQGVSIVRDPSDLPPAVGERGPTTIRYELEAIERIGRLADNTTFAFWTFNGKVPGPMLRVRVGDTVTLSLKNAPDSVMMHNIDLHAVAGPGGGAVLTLVEPGETKGFTFKATQPGLYVYHCATPMVANHISSGMYGMILVEPVVGLPKVDREFYVMQGELYTADAIRQERTAGIQRRQADGRASGVLHLQRRRGCADRRAPAPRQDRRDRAHLFRRRRTELHLVVPCHRHDLRSRLQHRKPRQPAADWRADHLRAHPAGPPSSTCRCRCRGATCWSTMR